MSSPGFLSGRGATTGTLLSARQSEQLAVRLQAQARHAEQTGEDAQVEDSLRRALEALVDAFLLDRRGHADCFGEAHQLGRELLRRFGCNLIRDERGTWGRSCGVLALHSRIGLSFAGLTRGRCSICNEPDLNCSHVPGQVYDDLPCVRIVEHVEVSEVSVVEFPDDPRCYRLFLRKTDEDIKRARGALPASAMPTCTHCSKCPAAEEGPTPEDLDQNLWPRNVDLLE